MKKIIIIALALLVPISFEFAYSQQSRNYTEADNNIEVNTGDDIVITLEANYITGFRWQLAEDLNKGILELVNIEPILGYARFLGAGGKEAWTIKAVGAGKTTISLEYVSPREMNAPAKEKTFTVTVTEPSGTAKQPE